MKFWLVGLLSLYIMACEKPAASGYMDLTGENVIYGEDDIQEELSLEKNSLASVALIKTEVFEDVLSGGEPYTIEEMTGLSEFAWRHQASLSFCSGVLIRPDLVLTAGHCAEAFKCEEFLAVSGYDQRHSIETLKGIACNKIEVIHNRVGQNDWALISLKSAFELPVVEVATQRTRIGETVYSIGYPLGAPKKRTSGKVRFVDHNQNYHVSLDAFVGQSGSPVFDQKTHQLIGVLSNGEDDPTDSGGRLQVKRCAEMECLGERIISVENMNLNMKE